MKKKKGNGFLLLVIAAVILAAQWLGLLGAFDHQLQDSKYQTGGLVSPEVYVIGIDEKTLMEYGPWQTWSREKSAELIALLNEEEMTAPAVIAFDIGFFGESDEAADLALAEAASLRDNVVTTSYATFGKELDKQNGGGFTAIEAVQTYERPYPGLAEHVSWGFSNVPLDSDGIVRHSLYQMEVDDHTEYSFAAEVYRKYYMDLPDVILEGNTKGYIPFSGFPYDYYGSETAGLSFCDVLNGTIPREMFAGCIVLIGPYSAGMMDSYYTAVSKDVPMYGVEVHANILQAFLEQNVKTELPLSHELLISALIMGLVLAGFFTKNLLFETILAAGMIAGYWFLAGKQYEAGTILPLLYPIAGAAAIYIGQIALQYITEQRAKKHIQSVFGRYVSDSVVAEIIKGGESSLKLGGQKRDIAVLFVDIRGFTTLSESIAPEQVVEMLNQYFQITTGAIFHNNGTVDKFIGDATMALFGAPMELDDYVFRAVKTGLEIVENGKKMQAELKELHGWNVGMGVGIHCGDAVVGNIGTINRMEYTAIGSTVNTASRLEGQAKAGEVVISPEVRERLGDRIIVESKGLCTLKGIAEPKELFRVTGIAEHAQNVHS